MKTGTDTGKAQKQYQQKCYKCGKVTPGPTWGPVMCAECAKKVG